MIPIVERYLEAKSQIKSIRFHTAGRLEHLNSEYEKEHLILRDQISELESQVRDAFEANRVQNQELHNEKIESIRPLEDDIEQTDRIISLLELAENFEEAKDIPDDRVSTRNGRFMQWLDYIHRDQYLKIRLLISGNDNRTNKYTLVAYGYCVFTKQVLMPHDYSNLHVNDWQAHFDITGILKTFPTVDDAIAYAAKGKTKPSIKQVIDDVGDMERLYVAAIEEYKLSDFDPICMATQDSDF